jgi:cardiolipin synthase (CMP-forming)
MIIVMELRMILTIPTVLTLLRLLLVPFVVLMLVAGEARWAFALLSVALATDFFDGFLARRLQQETQLGAFLDHFTDKVLAIALFVTFLYVPVGVPLWLIWLVLVKEVAVLLFVAFLMLRGIFYFAPLIVGKIAMAVQMMFAVWVIAAQAWQLPVYGWMNWFVACVVACTLLLYCVSGWKLVRRMM